MSLVSNVTSKYGTLLDGWKSLTPVNLKLESATTLINPNLDANILNPASEANKIDLNVKSMEDTQSEIFIRTLINEETLKVCDQDLNAGNFYISSVVNEMLKEAAKYVDSVDKLQKGTFRLRETDDSKAEIRFHLKVK